MECMNKYQMKGKQFMRDKQENFRIWLEKANEDYNVAKYLKESYHPAPHSTICYLSQQSIEKALKAFLIYHDQEYDRTHNLSFLKYDVDQKIGDTLKDLDNKALDILTRFEVVGRYPTDEIISEEDSDFALLHTSKYLSIIENEIMDDIVIKAEEKNETEEDMSLGDIKENKMTDTNKWLQYDEKFRYLLLRRLQQDCDYYLGNGSRHEKHLWAGNVDDQIKTMVALYNSFNEDKKPEWITLDEIEQYQDKMSDHKIEPLEKHEDLQSDLTDELDAEIDSEISVSIKM